MSTSLAYHTLSLKGYTVHCTGYDGNLVRFRLEAQRSQLVCPVCGSRHVIRKGSVHREFKGSRFGIKFIRLCLDVSRVLCKECGCLRQIALNFADPGCSYTRELARSVVQLSRLMPMDSVAWWLGLSWDMVRRILKSHLKRRFAHPDLRHLRRLAIDEISVRKGQRYLTLVMNLDSGEVVFVGDGNGADALEPFWKMLEPKRRARVQAVGIDLSAAYTKGVSENLPKAKIVYDHFHMVKLTNDCVTKVRRETQNAAEGCGRRLLKGLHWLLVKGSERLDEMRGEPLRLQQALAINRPLAAAYYMKEDLRQLWAQPDKDTASSVLDEWIWTAENSGIRALARMGQTLRRCRDGILDWYDCRITSGMLEGVNNKIKTLKRQAYGFRDMEFFKLRILAIHEARYAFCG